MFNMKKFFKFALAAVLAFTFVGNASADEISCDPINIGPGQVVTLNFYVTVSADDRNAVQFSFDFPAGVQVVGVDYTSTAKKGENVPFELNSAIFSDAALAKGNSSFKFRGKAAKWKHAFAGDFAQEIEAPVGEKTRLLSVDIQLAEGAAAVNGQVVFNDEPGECGVGGGETAISYETPASVEANVSDKFIAPCNADGYCTICPTVGLDLSGVDAYIVTGASGESVTLKKITELAAGDAAVVKGSGNVEIPLKSGAATSESGNKLVGVQKYTDTSGAAEYFLVGAEFVKAATTSHLAAGRAYLAGLGSGAKVLNLSFDDDATAIQSVEAEQNNGVLYNLNGVRVDNAVKGVYIQNGRKVVIK